MLGGVRFAERRELLVASREPHHDVTVHRVQVERARRDTMADRDEVVAVHGGVDPR